MAMSEHVRRLRAVVGHELILLPSVSVLPRDKQRRILLVKSVDSGHWHTIGGAVEIDEDPRASAVRESLEEANVVVQLGKILGVFGGPEYRITYPNGDCTAYVTTAYDAVVIGGSPAPDGDETSDARWFDLSEIADLQLSSFTRAMFRDLSLMPSA